MVSTFLFRDQVTFSPQLPDAAWAVTGIIDRTIQITMAQQSNFFIQIPPS